MRDGKELVLATRDYAAENRALSWWHVLSTLAVFGGLLYLITLGLPWYGLLALSVLVALVLTRVFVIYHDFQHGTILVGSTIARVLFWIYGVIYLTPPSIWNRSHNHHHRNNAKIFGASIGSYPVMTTSTYATASSKQRFAYQLTRHPLTIGAAYFTVFLYGMCLRSFLADPKQHWDSLVSLIVHAAVIVALAIVSPSFLVFGFLIPTALATALGAYLFYAQHNYPKVVLRDRAQWDHAFAALNSSSFMRMSPFMHWCTANIGYHHVHHLNPHIPFYRLPEAMAGIEELQSPGETSLLPWDIWKCFQLKLWCPQKDRLVTMKGVGGIGGRSAGDAGLSSQTPPARRR